MHSEEVNGLAKHFKYTKDINYDDAIVTYLTFHHIIK
jgi:hypothetical protein